jgi:hypothetical protein
MALLLQLLVLVLVLVPPMADSFLLLPGAPRPQQSQSQPVRPAARGGAAGQGPVTVAVTPRAGPDHSDEPVIKPHSAGAHGSRRGGGPKDEMARRQPPSPPQLEEQDLLQQLLESMGRDSLSEKTLDSVLRVYCTHVQPSFAAPWQRLQQISSTSSGFVIEGRRVITNAHSVEVRCLCVLVVVCNVAGTHLHVRTWSARQPRYQTHHHQQNKTKTKNTHSMAPSSSCASAGTTPSGSPSSWPTGPSATWRC